MGQHERYGKLGVAAVLLMAGCSKAEKDGDGSRPPSDESPAPSIAVAPPAAEPPRAESPRQLLMSKTTLAEAVATVRSEMTDTDDSTSPGAVLLALWAVKHLKWADVAVAKNETSPALVRKDSDASRGKRMCVRGRLIQIQKENVDGGAVFSGLLLSGYTEITSFIVAGSTGELVAQSRARLCGVVIGTYDYSNSAGGKGHAISLVGMFDLPENRTR